MTGLMIEVYPMNKDCVIADRWGDVAFYDVLVRPDGADPVEEIENLRDDEIDDVVEKLLAKYPGAVDDWQLLDLLQ